MNAATRSFDALTEIVSSLRESPMQTIARLENRTAKEKRDDYCHCHVACDDLIDTLAKAGLRLEAEMVGLQKLSIENRMREWGVREPIEEVEAYVEELPVCGICGLSEVNCRCDRDDVDELRERLR